MALRPVACIGWLVRGASWTCASGKCRYKWLATTDIYNWRIAAIMHCHHLFAPWFYDLFRFYYTRLTLVRSFLIPTAVSKDTSERTYDTYHRWHPRLPTHHRYPSSPINITWRWDQLSMSSAKGYSTHERHQ